MTMNVAINGFGRIGRNIFRANYERGLSKDIKIVAINDLGNADINAHLLKHDSVHGAFSKKVDVKDNHLVIDNNDEVLVLSEKDPSKLPWKKLNVDWLGTDINPFWSEFGHKNEVPISNQPIDLIENKFDVITAHQVIEHVEDPLKFMKAIKSLLKPRGVVHLELPNQFGLSARLRKISPKISKDYGFIQPPMHLRAYSKETIKYLFDSLGLQSQMAFTCGNTNKIWGQAREYSLPQKLYYTFSGKIGMGSLLIGIAQIKS